MVEGVEGAVDVVEAMAGGDDGGGGCREVELRALPGRPAAHAQLPSSRMRRG